MGGSGRPHQDGGGQTLTKTVALCLGAEDPTKMAGADPHVYSSGEQKLTKVAALCVCVGRRPH